WKPTSTSIVPVVERSRGVTGRAGWRLPLSPPPHATASKQTSASSMRTCMLVPLGEAPGPVKLCNHPRAVGSRRHGFRSVRRRWRERSRDTLRAGDAQSGREHVVGDYAQARERDRLTRVATGEDADRLESSRVVECALLDRTLVEIAQPQLAHP